MYSTVYNRDIPSVCLLAVGASDDGGSADS